MAPSPLQLVCVTMVLFDTCTSSNVTEEEPRQADSYNKSLVEDALPGFLRNGSIEEVIRGMFLGEVDRLKSNVGHLQAQVDILTLHATRAEMERDNIRDQLSKYSCNGSASGRQVREENILKDSVLYLKAHISTLTRRVRHVEQERAISIETIEKLQIKCEALTDIEHNVTVLTKALGNMDGMNSVLNVTKLKGNNSVKEDNTTRGDCEESSTMFTPTKTSQKSRIIIVPLSSNRQESMQLHLNNNTLKPYPAITRSWIHSVVYVQRLRRILIGTRHPNRIFRFPLDGSKMNVFKRNILTYGMAVDEGRQLLFLTTHIPRYTISRMTTQGRQFTSLVNESFVGRFPQSITVDPLNKIVYAACYLNLISVSYDGSKILTLYSSTDIFAVSLGPTGLYFNEKRKVMKMRPGGTNVTEVMELEVKPRTFVFYNNSMYTGSYAYGQVGVLHFTDCGRTIVYQDLYEVVSSWSMCLIP